MRRLQLLLVDLYCKRRWRLIGVGIFLIILLWGGLSAYFHSTPIDFAENGLRVIAVPVLAKLYNDDEDMAALLRERYWVGEKELMVSSPLESWRRIESQLPGFQVLEGNGTEQIKTDIPFVYESMHAPHLAKLREYYKLNELVSGVADEYEAMLRLGAWVGSQWDHGADSVPGGTVAFDPIEVIQAGNNGAKFWCEIATKVTVYAATALGWPARALAASRDGYTWEHAVTELWSNQYNKWFVIDADFNIVYEKDGIPLSAFELCHDGPNLQDTNQLQVRPIAPHKPSLPLMDLIPFYRYIHIDLRTDWNTRNLRRGSPTGGDLATWWTARPSLGNILTAKIRVDNREQFNWKVNTVSIYALGVDLIPETGPVLQIGLVGYSPFFETFQVSINDTPWEEVPIGKFPVQLAPGKFSIKARVITENEGIGPVYEIKFQRS